MRPILGVWEMLSNSKHRIRLFRTPVLLKTMDHTRSRLQVAVTLSINYWL